MNPTLMNQRQTDLTEEMKVRKEDNQIDIIRKHIQGLYRIRMIP
jgi:hypothetical protein